MKPIKRFWHWLLGRDEVILYEIRIRQGSGQRWRWFIEDRNDALVAQGPPHGFDTSDDAEVAVTVFLEGIKADFIERV